LSIALLVGEGVFTPEDLAEMQAILDEVCHERGFARGSPQREDIAFRLIALYKNSVHDKARIKAVLMRRRFPGDWARLADDVRVVED
jgi:hypothetical protein